VNFKQVAVLLATALFAAAALSGEHVRHKVAIVIDSGDEGETRIELDSDDLGISLRDMQVGENQSIVDKEGRSILITRIEDGFTFDVDGKTVNMPAFDGQHREKLWAHRGHGMANVDVHVMHDMMSGDATDMDGVMIISGTEIDAATQQLIRSALEAAGHSDVSFAGGDGDGQHEVRIIKKVVHRTESASS
jgi:hypothetical protein